MAERFPGQRHATTDALAAIAVTLTAIEEHLGPIGDAAGFVDNALDHIGRCSRPSGLGAMLLADGALGEIEAAVLGDLITREVPAAIAAVFQADRRSA